MVAICGGEVVEQGDGWVGGRGSFVDKKEYQHSLYREGTSQFQYLTNETEWWLFITRVTFMEYLCDCVVHVGI